MKMSVDENFIKVSQIGKGVVADLHIDITSHQVIPKQFGIILKRKRNNTVVSKTDQTVVLVNEVNQKILRHSNQLPT